MSCASSATAAPSSSLPGVELHIIGRVTGCLTVLSRSEKSAFISLRKPIKLVASVIAMGLLSSCTYLQDWSLLHHQRLYDLYRLIANHELADGNLLNAQADLKKALQELALAKPEDTDSKEQSTLDLGGMYLACGEPKSAIECYNRIADKGLLAECIAGKGFCLLALNQKEEAASEFHKALKEYETNPRTTKTNPFPIDYCPNCCVWGLTQSAHKSNTPIKVSLVRGQPIPSECLTSRLILSRMLQRISRSDATIAGTKKDQHILASGEQPNGLQDSWTTLYRAGKRCAKREDNDRAERYFKSALSLLRKSKENDIRLTETLETLSSFYLGLDRRQDAIPYLEEEVALKKARFGDGDIALIDPIRRYGFAQMREGNFSVADKALTEALAICVRSNMGENELTARIWSNLCELRIGQGRFKDAEALGRKSLATFNKLYPSGDYRLAVPHFLLAKALIGQNRFADAEPILLMSSDALDHSAVAGSIKLDILLTNAELALKRGDLASAKNAIRTAREIVRKIGTLPANQGHTAFDRIKKRMELLEKMTRKAVD